MSRRVVFGSLFAFILFSPIAHAVLVDVVDWTTSAGDGPLTQQATNDPIVGDGTTDSAKSEAIHAAISGTIPSLNGPGERVTLSGEVVLVGSSSSDDQFRWGLFDVNGKATIKGWLGYFASNAITNSESILRERSNPNGADFFSGTSATQIAFSNASTTAFSAGTYTFSLSLERTISDGLQIGWGLTRTSGSTVYALVGSFFDPTPQTFSFNRVGFNLGGSLNADQAQFHDITIQHVPEPSGALMAFVGLSLIATRRARR